MDWLSQVVTCSSQKSCFRLVRIFRIIQCDGNPAGQLFGLGISLLQLGGAIEYPLFKVNIVRFDLLQSSLPLGE